MRFGSIHSQLEASNLTRPSPHRPSKRFPAPQQRDDPVVGLLNTELPYRCTTARHARTAGRPLDAGNQPDAGGQIARADQRSDLGRRDPRPAGAQRLSHQTEGRIDAQTRNETDDDRDLRLTMKTRVAALRQPVQVNVERVSKWSRAGVSKCRGIRALPRTAAEVRLYQAASGRYLG